MTSVELLLAHLTYLHLNIILLLMFIRIIVRLLKKFHQLLTRTIIKMKCARIICHMQGRLHQRLQITTIKTVKVTAPYRTAIANIATKIVRRHVSSNKPTGSNTFVFYKNMLFDYIGIHPINLESITNLGALWSKIIVTELV